MVEKVGSQVQGQIKGLSMRGGRIERAFSESAALT